jgi:hypothetical protein
VWPKSGTPKRFNGQNLTANRCLSLGCNRNPTLPPKAMRSELPMPRWMKDKLTWILVLALITAGSSGYSAYKIYLMTDGKAAPAKGRR